MDGEPDVGQFGQHTVSVQVGFGAGWAGAVVIIGGDRLDDERCACELLLAEGRPGAWAVDGTDDCWEVVVDGTGFCAGVDAVGAARDDRVGGEANFVDDARHTVAQIAGRRVDTERTRPGDREYCVARGERKRFLVEDVSGVVSRSLAVTTRSVEGVACRRLLVRHRVCDADVPINGRYGW